MKFHHIGIACSDILETVKFLNSTFNIINMTEIYFDKNQNVDLCLLTDEFGINIELVSGKTVEKFIKNKQFLYHNCWEVVNLEKAIEHFCDNGATVISEKKPAILFDNRNVAFLFTKIGIIELLEEKASG
jgi:methylmalonyl-CoA/ethylmalonyl-CoA epimerase